MWLLTILFPTRIFNALFSIVIFGEWLKFRPTFRPTLLVRLKKSPIFLSPTFFLPKMVPAKLHFWGHSSEILNKNHEITAKFRLYVRKLCQQNVLIMREWISILETFLLDLKNFYQSFFLFSWSFRTIHLTSPTSTPSHSKNYGRIFFNFEAKISHMKSMKSQLFTHSGTQYVCHLAIRKNKFVWGYDMTS